MSERKLTEEEQMLRDLGVEIDTQTKAAEYTPKEERIISGFEDIVRFYEKEGRLPRNAHGNDIFESLYAIRLERLRELEGAKELLAPFDKHNLLSEEAPANDAEHMSEDEMLAMLGVLPDENSITTLKHVPDYETRKTIEDKAVRTPCKDFGEFESLFEAVKVGLNDKTWMTRIFEDDFAVYVGDFFILNGQMVYVAEMGEMFESSDGKMNSRLRVIYDNATESDILMLSLQRALYKDNAGRRLVKVPVDDGSLFTGIPINHASPDYQTTMGEDDIVSGTIYVLQSLSNEPTIAKHRELIHKIGVTGGRVRTRIANAANDPTYLLADVKVVAEYDLANINRTKLEHLIHRVLAPAQLDIEIKDRFGKPVHPQEWFLVPLSVVDELVKRIIDGTAIFVTYDPEKGQLVEG
jgi:hypothetical protein